MSCARQPTRSLLFRCIFYNQSLPSLLGHVTPEAHLGGPIALVEDGDKITVDAKKRTIEWHVSEEVRATRQASLINRGPRPFTVRRGVLLRYARDVAVSFNSPSWFCVPIQPHLACE